MSDSSNSPSTNVSSLSAPHNQRNEGTRFKFISSLIARLRNVISNLLRSKNATIGALIFIVWILIAIFAPIISPFSPTEMPGSRLEDPSLEHWLGTDHLGRDVMSRLFWGTRMVLLLSPVSVLLGLIIGAPLGLISGYVGGAVDTLIMRAGDILYSFPSLLLFILIITTYDSSPLIVVAAVALGNVTFTTRIVRSLVLDERTKDYVSAARLRGERRSYILLKEILPNVTGPLIVDTTIRIGYAIIYIGSLGFLGLGIPPPTPDWGGMISEGFEFIFLMPWVALAPAVAISSVVIGLNLFADGIREIEQQH